MGTNYYLYDEVCDKCGRSDEDKLHIGKSSAGWCFSLRVYPERGINCLDDWMKLLEGGVIKNEYNHVVSIKELLSAITHRGSGIEWDSYDWSWTGYKSEEEFHRANGSERGPNGMLRHRLDKTNSGTRTVGHGEGTWDCIEGEFS